MSIFVQNISQINARCLKKTLFLLFPCAYFQNQPPSSSSFFNNKVRNTKTNNYYYLFLMGSTYHYHTDKPTHQYFTQINGIIW